MKQDCIKNILLLSIEDLNDWIGPLGGHPQAHTPNLDKLAKRSVVFDQAYAAAPACSPSRTTTLFGQAPWRLGMYTNKQSWATFFEPGAHKSIVGQAKKAGWRTMGAGKVFHLGSGGLDRSEWDHFYEPGVDRMTPISKVAMLEGCGPFDDFGPISDDCAPLRDDRAVDHMISQIKAGTSGNFWCFGSFRPHLPFIVPQRYFDLIPEIVSEPPGLIGKPFDANDMSELDQLPEEARKIATTGLGSMLQQTGEYNAFLRAYLASIAYADDIVGRLLDHLERLDLLDETLIVFWSDHGWQLGEKLCFRKFTLWERALRVPLFISGPGIAAGRTSEPVSLLDIYPTLQSILGTAPPHPLDGQDLSGILSGGNGIGYAVSAWERLDRVEGEGSTISITVRDAFFRLIVYPNGDMELYETSKDPFEHHNLLTGPREVPPELTVLVDRLLKTLPQKICASKSEALPEPLLTDRKKDIVQIC